MAFLDNLSLRRLVQFTVLALCLVLSLACLSAGHTNKQLETQVAWVTHTYQVQLRLLRIDSQLREHESRYRGYLLTGQQDMLGDIRAIENEIRKDMAETQAMTLDNPHQIERLSGLAKLVEEKLEFGSAIVAQVQANQSAAARNQILSMKGELLSRVLEARVSESVTEESQLLAAREQMVERSRSRLRTQLYGAVVVGAVLAFVLTRLLNRRLAPLISGTEMARAIGHGDLTRKPLTVAGQDEVGQLAASLNGMLGSLQRMADDTRAASADLAAAVQQISANVQEQAVSSQQQLAAVQETATTMEEISVSSEQIAERARSVSEGVAANIQGASAGVQSLGETMKAVEAIRDRSQQLAATIFGLSEKTLAVEAIVDTVDDLADRSALLALNAAVQAAAVGDQGQNFAVVAGEMKLLAEQSKSAYDQVRTLLSELQRGIQQSVFYTEETVRRVQAGSVATGESDRTLKELVSTIEESSRAFQQIGAATNQQQLAFTQVTQALHAIRQAAGQSEQSTRHLLTAATDLGSMGEHLQETVSQYQLA